MIPSLSGVFLVFVQLTIPFISLGVSGQKSTGFICILNHLSIRSASSMRSSSRPFSSTDGDFSVFFKSFGLRSLVARFLFPYLVAVSLSTAFKSFFIVIAAMSSFFSTTFKLVWDTCKASNLREY